MRTRLAVAAVIALSAVGLVGAVAGPVARQAAADPASHVVVDAKKVTFAPIEVPGFPSGMKIATIHGDPNAPSGMYVIRLQFPAGYRFPPHWHPNAENLTVLSGEFLLAMGEKAEPAKLMTYTPGTFMYIPGKMPHYGGVKGTSTIQLHGEAPFKIELVAASAK